MIQVTEQRAPVRRWRNGVCVGSGFFVEQGTEHFIHGFQDLGGCLYLDRILPESEHGLYQAGGTIIIELAGAGNLCGVIAGAGEAALYTQHGL